MEIKTDCVLIMKNLSVVLLVVALATINCTVLSRSSAGDELKIYDAKILALQKILADECPQLAAGRRRQLDGLDVSSISLTVAKTAYSTLLGKLVECKKAQVERATSTNTILPTSTSTPTTTAPVAIPSECLAAANYSEAWRRDHRGSDLKAGGPHSILGYACDLNKADTQWFRFTCAAGSRILDYCPRWFSCGTMKPLWSDEPMPGVVGVSERVKVFAVERGFCKQETHTMEVMRCSYDTPHDFIYRQDSNYPGGCAYAFCGRGE